uniref:Golgi integral membrane protein 4a n=1 Tax=Cyprinus carpio carpio TaxID=630221 RepID=A0A8C1C0F6_CYPCA
MGNGVCSRKQKKIFQSLLLVTVVFGMIYGGMFSYEMHKQLKRTEEMAVKYQQHQESLSAQLQVVYEHRSRLEKSLQKERLEHKKSKDGKFQDSGVRFNSLHSQHQILKNQHDELKKQYYELQEQHQLQEDEHNKALDEHKQRLDQLHQTKESEISKLKENIFNLHEENKQLRKAHQEVYVQLQDTRQQHKNLKSTHDQLVLTLEDHKSALAAAQVQVDEYKQLKETLNKMPSLRHESAQLVQNRNAEEPHQPQDVAPAEAHVQHVQVERGKSAYEQQREQQRLAAQLAEERRQLHLHQEALHKQQLQQQKEKEERLRLQREKEEQQNREADLKEQQLQQEMLRKKAQYENVDADIVQGEEEPQTAEEKEVNVHHEEARQNEADHVHREDERPVEVEVDPENDPNNQGEDEFEEAEHQQPHEEEEEEEEVAPVGHPDMHLAVENQHLPPAEDQLVMDGNPDQQEDALDEQYQEDGDDEAQDELVDNQKREAVREEEGDPYNEENGEQEEARDQDLAVKQDNQPAQRPNEENYEEEEEVEEDGNGDKPPGRRAEM